MTMGNLDGPFPAGPGSGAEPRCGAAAWRGRPPHSYWEGFNFCPWCGASIEEQPRVASPVGSASDDALGGLQSAAPKPAGEAIAPAGEGFSRNPPVRGQLETTPGRDAWLWRCLDCEWDTGWATHDTTIARQEHHLADIHPQQMARFVAELDRNRKSH